MESKQFLRELEAQLLGVKADRPTLPCLYCGKLVPAKEIDAHVEGHSPQERLQTLLNADSVFSFTALEKSFLPLLADGKSDAEIASTLKIPLVTSRWLKNGLIEKMRQAKAMLLLDDLMGDRLTRREYRRAENDENDIPQLGQDNAVLGFYREKRQLHSAGLLHPTVIILVAKIDEHGAMSLLICDKADKRPAAYPAADEDTAVLHAYDLLGGHCKRMDMPAPTEKTFDFTGVMQNTARRELFAELSLKSSKPDPTRLIYLYQDRYQGPVGDGVNHEISNVYLYPVWASDTAFFVERGVRVKDDWMDSIGRRVVRTFPCRFWALEEIQALISARRALANDGLLRVLDALGKTPSLFEKVIGALRENTAATPVE